MYNKALKNTKFTKNMKHLFLVSTYIEDAEINHVFDSYQKVLMFLKNSDVNEFVVESVLVDDNGNHITTPQAITEKFL